MSKKKQLKLSVTLEGWEGVSDKEGSEGGIEEGMKENGGEGSNSSSCSSSSSSSSSSSFSPSSSSAFLLGEPVGQPKKRQRIDESDVIVIDLR